MSARDDLIKLGAEALADIILKAQAVMDERREATAADNSSDCGYRHGLEAAKSIIDHEILNVYEARLVATSIEAKAALERLRKVYHVDI